MSKIRIVLAEDRHVMRAVDTLAPMTAASTWWGCLVPPD